MDPRRLRTGDVVAGGAGLVLLIALFLPWYENVGVGGGVAREVARNIARASHVDTAASGWESFAALDFLLALVALTAIALAVLTAAQRSPAIPIALDVAVTFLGGVATVLVLYRLVNEPGTDELID